MIRAFRYRIYPTAEQEARLARWESALRFLWNLALEQYLIGAGRPRGERVYPTAFGQGREFTVLRAEHAWLADLPRKAGDAVFARLHNGWRSCWKRKARAPRFKRKGRDAVSVRLAAREVIWRASGIVTLAKLGACRVVAHRRLVGRTVRVELCREADQWFVVFVQELAHAATARLPGVVGLDRGVVSLVADSDGNHVAGPRFAERSKRKLARAQRALQRTKKGSKNRDKDRLRLARAHRKVRRQRAWLQHQISHDYANSHGVVVIEKLETARMTRSARGSVDSPGRNVRTKASLNRRILDAGWSGLADKLRYKLEERGGELVEVPAAYSSQTCSRCGVVDAASRRTQSEFSCTGCGHQENADTNAARVILSRWSPPVQPVEACDGAA